MNHSKRNIFPFIFFTMTLFNQINAQWIWMHGDSVPGSVGNIGMQGVASPTNDPRNRNSAQHWTDQNGKLWMYGGACQINLAQSYLEDMWQFDPPNNQWTWISGDTLANQLANYGIMTIPTPTNNPAGRAEAATWQDSNGNFWFYGGSFYSGTGTAGDMWKYDVATQLWTWESGSTQSQVPPSYGPLGVFSPLSYPGARRCCGHSVDAIGNFWLFGGVSDIPYSTAFNDLWEYDPTLNLWAWMGGGVIPGSYGTKGVSSPTNWPNKRNVFCSFDTGGNELWFWSGLYSGFYADLWKYDKSSTDWTWMSGTNTISNMTGCSDPGVTAGQCIPDTNDRPGFHVGNEGYSCTDKCGNFWVMGGFSPSCWFPNNLLNDLWNYNTATREWTFVSGQLSAGFSPSYGIKTVAAPSNVPGQRVRSSMWCSNGLWLFGGSETIGHINDMWVFAPHPVASFTDSIITCNFVQFTDHSQAQCGGEIHSWKWDFGDGNTSTLQNPTHAYAATGNYSVTLIATNCVDVADTVSSIVNFPGAALFLNAQIVPAACSGNNGSVSVTVTGTGPYTYVWSPSLSTTSQIIGLAAGGYSLLVTDQTTGCQLTQQFTIALADSISASATVIPMICQTPGSAVIAVSGSNGVYSYVWSPPVSTSASATGLTAGIYTVVVSDTSGCRDTVVFNVPQVISQLLTSTSSGPTLCAGSTEGWVNVNASGSMGPISYSWQPGNFSTDSVSNLGAGIYIVHVTDGYGCNVIDSTVIMQPFPITPQISIQGNDSFCAGHSLFISFNAIQGTPPYTYLLQPNNFTSYTPFGYWLQPSTTITYTLIVTDTNGCVDSASQLLYVEQLPTVSFESVLPGCVPLDVTFYDLSSSVESPITSWYWEFGDGGTSVANSPSYIYNVPGVYDVILTVTTAMGCVGSDTAHAAVVAYPVPVAGFMVSENSIFPGDSVSFTDQSIGGVSFSWNFGDGQYSSLQNPVHLFAGYPSAGNEFHIYQIVENSYGCIDTADYFIPISGAEVYAPNAFSPNGDGLNDFFYLQGFGFETENLLIFDRWGNLIYDNANQPWDGMFKGNKVQQDVYVWKATVKFPDGNRKYLFGHVMLVR